MAVLRVTRIPVPAWAPDHDRGAVKRSEGFAEEDYQAIQAHRDVVLAFLHTTVESYLRHMALEDYFPRRDHLTGEYYIGSECYCYAPPPLRGPGEYCSTVQPIFRMNFRVRCLQWPRPPHVPRSDDYLGLDVEIRCNPVDWRFCVYATDSSVI